MNDNKSRDIFYGVVAIATLIVAIVGATLAYFSISASSDEGAVSAKAAVVSINYDDTTKVAVQADALIPASLGVMQYFYELNKEDLGTEIATPKDNPEENVDRNICKDDYGKQVCSIYRFTASVNTGSKLIKAFLNTENNTFSTGYLSYAVRDVNCTYQENLNTVDKDTIDASSVTKPYDKCWINLGSTEEPVKSETLTACNNDGVKELGACSTMNGTQKVYVNENGIKATNSIFGGVNDTPNTQEISGVPRVFDLVIFLKESGSDQNIDQGAEYSGTLKVEVADSNEESSQITGRVKKN